jgi:hypothetical protein
MPVKGKKKRKKPGDCWCIRMAYYGIYGVILGMLAKVAASQECLLVLPMRAQWIAKWDYQFYCNYTACWAFRVDVISYFSAILSTADSCLMAASNIVTI